MQGQLWDAAQGGQREDTEADRAQGTVRSAAKEAAYRVGKLVRGRRKDRARTHEGHEKPPHTDPHETACSERPTSATEAEPAVSPSGGESTQIKTRDSVYRSSSMDIGRADLGQSELPKIKTKDACIQRQGADVQLRKQKPVVKDTAPSGHQLAQPIEQGHQRFAQARETEISVSHAEKTRVKDRADPLSAHGSHGGGDAYEEYLGSPGGSTAVHSDHPQSQPLEQGRKKFIQERQTATARRSQVQRRMEGRTAAARQQGSVDAPLRKTSTPSVQSGDQSAKRAARETISGGKRQIKAARSGVKATGRTSRQTIKTAEHTAKTTVKTAERGAKAVQKTTQATVKATRQAVEAARATVQTAATSSKAVARATVSAIKAAIAAVQELAAAIAASGGAVIAVVLVLCLVGALLMSPLGMFFCGEDIGTGQTVSSAVREINQEYDARVEELKTETPHDELSLSGSRATWPEVLAVYAVKTVTDPTNGHEVITMDDEKKELLKQVFWDMNELSSFTSTVLGEGDDEEDTTTLHITVTAKTASEMADIYGFNVEQRQALAELLSDEYRELWSAVLYGIGTGSSEIVAVALSQVGNVGGQPYWNWYGFGSRVDWCAIFVSWCANECGYIDAGIVPKFAGCVQGSRWFKDRGLWQDRNYTPNPGDVIFFDWNDPGGFSGPQDGVPDHVGIVERVENGRVYTVEGNSGDKCCQQSYPVGYYEIYGYGMLCN